MNSKNENKDWNVRIPSAYSFACEYYFKEANQVGYVSAGISKGSCLITGLDESNESQFVSIYPNPSKSSFHINISKPTDLQVIDVEGKLCEEHKNVSSIEFGENLKPGIYFLKIENKVYKLVKE